MRIVHGGALYPKYYGTYALERFNIEELLAARYYNEHMTVRNDDKDPMMLKLRVAIVHRVMLVH